MSRFQLLPFLSVHAILLSGRQPPLPLARMRKTVLGPLVVVLQARVDSKVGLQCLLYFLVSFLHRLQFSLRRGVL